MSFEGPPIPVPQEPEPLRPDSQSESVMVEDHEHAEALEGVSKSLRRLSIDFDELSATISRNGFPRANFDLEGIDAQAASSERLDPKKLAEGLDGLAQSVGRIRLPEDQRDMAELEAHNFQRVVDGLEQVEGSLVRLNGTCDAFQDDDMYNVLANEIGKIRASLDSKKEEFGNAKYALQRNRER